MGEHVGSKNLLIITLNQAIMEKLQNIWIEYINIYVLLNFGEDPSSIMEVMPMCPIVHVPIPKVPHLYLQY